VLERVPEEVLEHRAEPLAVRVDGPVGGDLARRVSRLDGGPGPLGSLGHGDRLRLGDGLPLAGQRQGVVDDGRHPVVGLADLLDVLAVLLALDQRQVPRRDVQRVPEVV
jgi:hypothetical protein